MFGPDFRDFVSQEQSQSSKILKKSDSGDSGAEEEFEVLEQEEIKERRHSGDSGNCSEAEEGQNTNRAIELEFQLTQDLLSQVKADENNRNANSGKQAELDLKRMNFVINGKTIGKECVLRSYGKNNHLIPNGNEDYRTFAKQVFTEMFKHAKAEVPDDHILEELITSCNQAGYSALLAIKMHNILIEYQLFFNDYDKRTTYIDCSDKNCVRINEHKSSVVRNSDDPEKEICELGSSLEFTLKSQNDRVEYENGKVTLTIPEQLKDYKVGRKSLLGDIKSCFEDADNVVIESLVENIGEGPKSFIVDLPAEVDSDSFDIIPENAVFDLGHIPELIKKAVDDKDVNALANHIGFFQDHVTHVSPKKGLSVVEKTLKIVSDFIEGQGKVWNHYPTVPIANHIYSAKQYCNGYISQADYEKVENLKKNLCKIKSDLIKRSSNDHNAEPSVTNAQDTSAILNETPTSSQSVNGENNNQLNIQKDPKFKSTDSQQVIDKAQKTINEYNDDGFTPLHLAAQKGDVKLGRYLLQYGANIEITSKAKVDGCTALHLAVRNGHKDFVKLLLDSGANVNSVSSTGSGVTPLHEAAYDGHLDVAELLIERGATVDAKDRHNFTPLMYASAQGNSAVVKLLLQKKADLYLQNNNDETALHNAAGNGRYDVVAILIGAAEDKEKYVNTQSGDIGTALHVIAYNQKINEGHKKVAKLLIDNGASPYLENDPIINSPLDAFRKGNSLDIAKKQGNKEFLECMSSLGYSVTVDCVPSNSNNASQNTKRYVIAAATLAIAGIISGVAVAVYLEMLAVGIAVGACCLVAAAVIYYCNRPSNSLECGNVESVDNRKPTAQQTVN